MFPGQANCNTARHYYLSPRPQVIVPSGVPVSLPESPASNRRRPMRHGPLARRPMHGPLRAKSTGRTAFTVSNSTGRSRRGGFRGTGDNLKFKLPLTSGSGSRTAHPSPGSATKVQWRPGPATLTWPRRAAADSENYLSVLLRRQCGPQPEALSQLAKSGWSKGRAIRTSEFGSSQSKLEMSRNRKGKMKSCTENYSFLIPTLLVQGR